MHIEFGNRQLSGRELELEMLSNSNGYRCRLFNVYRWGTEVKKRVGIGAQRFPRAAQIRYDVAVHDCSWSGRLFTERPSKGHSLRQ